MQSSMMVVLRTLVMLGALVAVPTAALFGSSIWSRLAKVVAVLQEDLDAEEQDADHGDHSHEHLATPQATPGMTEVTGGVAGPTTAASLPQTPLAQGSLHDPGLMAAPPLSPPMTNAASMPQPVSPTAGPPASPATAATSASATTAAGKTALSSPPFWPSEPATAAAPVAQVQAHAPLAAPGNPQAMAANQAAYITPAGSTPMPPPPAFPGEPNDDTQQPQAESNTKPAGDPGQVAIERRLQTMGALHYRLETAGAQGELFRFQCKMGLEANPNYVGYFEATSSDAATAMHQVLEQVESWRAGVVRR